MQMSPVVACIFKRCYVSSYGCTLCLFECGCTVCISLSWCGVKSQSSTKLHVQEIGLDSTGINCTDSTMRMACLGCCVLPIACFFFTVPGARCLPVGTWGGLLEWHSHQHTRVLLSAFQRSLKVSLVFSQPVVGRSALCDVSHDCVEEIYRAE